MHLRQRAFFVLSMAAAVAGAWACGGGNGKLFAAAGTGAEGGASGGGSTVGSTGVTTGTATTTSTTGTTTGTGTSSGGGPYPAPFPTPPQVITYGGPVLSNPKIYPVFFAGDDPSTVASLTDFSQRIGATPYWTATTSEYGVGPATGEPAIQLAESAPGQIDDSGIQQWLAQKFAAGAPFPQPDADTLVVLYYPAGTTITLDGNASCQTFGGYHNGATVGAGQEIAYSVVPRCDNTVTTATSAASHELIEASTDPYPMTNPAYAQVDDEDFYWELLLQGGEVGDMCAQFPNVFAQFPGFPYAVQRTWSNASAMAGHDPCVPELPGEVYANAAPVMTDMATLNVQGQSVTVRTVHVPVGQSRSIPLDLFSEGPTSGPWTIQAIDPAPMLGSPQLLNLSVSPPSGVNGDVAMLNIDVMKAGPGNVELFFVISQQQSTQGVWIGLVSN
jgi:hypothetical protein